MNNYEIGLDFSMDKFHIDFRKLGYLLTSTTIGLKLSLRLRKVVP